MVKDLLTLSSLEAQAGKECQPVEVSELLNALAEEYGVLAEGCNVTLELHVADQGLIDGDRGKLYRAFSNILDNAIKFNVEGGRITISCRHQSDDKVVVSVLNPGPGVAEEELSQVFDQFYRGEKSRVTEFGGFGLGLAIVKKIMHLHRGEITFASGSGGVTKFTMLLPCRQ